MREWETAYIVRLDNGRITYINKCWECGWSDDDDSFFTVINGKPLCSLHREGK